MIGPSAALSDLMRAPRTVPCDATIAEAAILMQNWHVGALVLVDEERRPVGLVTDRDLALGAILRELDPGATEVSECASRPLVTIHRNATSAAATRTMREHRIRRLAVLDDAGGLCGVLTLDDVLEHLGTLTSGLASTIRHEVALESEAVRTCTKLGPE